MKRLIILLSLAALACGRAVPTPTPPLTPLQMSTFGEGKSPKRAHTIRTATICGAVNVREGPAAEGKVIRWLVDGKTVTVYEARGGWVRVGAGEWITEEALCR